MAVSTWADLLNGKSRAKVYADSSAHYAHITLGGGVSPEAFARALRFVAGDSAPVTIDRTGDIEYPSHLTPTVLTMLKRIYAEVQHVTKDNTATHQGTRVDPDVDDRLAVEASEFVWDLERAGYTHSHPAQAYRDMYSHALRRQREEWAEVEKAEDHVYVKAMMGLAGSEAS